MSDDERVDLPDDRIEETARQFQEFDVGAMSLQGRVGYHTLYSWDSDDITVAFDTALHMALGEMLRELWIDEDIVRDYAGEVTPETVAQVTVEQMHDLTGMRLDSLTEEQFIETLAEKLEQLSKHPDEIEEADAA